MRIHDKVLKFNCTYEQYGEVKDNFVWSGYVERTDLPLRLTQSNGFISTVEGVIVDYQMSKVMRTEIAPYKQYVVDYTDKRYLDGEGGMRHLDNVLEFVVFQTKGRPIDYEFRYDDIDDCFYGVWYFVTDEESNFEYGGYAKLVVEQHVEYTAEEIQKEISESDAYYKHAETISKLIEEQKSNLQLHDIENLERFAKAKEFFRGRGRTRQEDKKTSDN